MLKTELLYNKIIKLSMFAALISLVLLITDLFFAVILQAIDCSGTFCKIDDSSTYFRITIWTLVGLVVFFVIFSRVILFLITREHKLEDVKAYKLRVKGKDGNSSFSESKLYEDIQSNNLDRNKRTKSVFGISTFFHKLSENRSAKKIKKNTTRIEKEKQAMEDAEIEKALALQESKEKAILMAKKEKAEKKKLKEEKIEQAKLDKEKALEEQIEAEEAKAEEDRLEQERIKNVKLEQGQVKEEEIEQHKLKEDKEIKEEDPEEPKEILESGDSTLEGESIRKSKKELKKQRKAEKVKQAQMKKEKIEEGKLEKKLIEDERIEKEKQEKAKLETKKVKVDKTDSDEEVDTKEQVQIGQPDATSVATIPKKTSKPKEAKKTKADIIEYIEAQTGISKNKSNKFLKFFAEVVKEELAKGKDVNIPGFGKFTTILMPAKEAVNPQTNEKIIVPAHNQARLRFEDKFKKNFLPK